MYIYYFNFTNILKIYKSILRVYKSVHTIICNYFNTCSDIEKIREGIGVKLSLFVQLTTTFIAGFVIGFVRVWQLAALLLGITPFIIVTVVISYSVRIDNDYSISQL